MGAFFDNIKYKSAIDVQDECKTIDTVIIKYLRHYTNKYFDVWVKKFENKDIHVEISRGISTYVFVYKECNQTSYSLHRIYEYPFFYQYIDNRAEYLPIFNTYESQANGVGDEYFLISDLVVMTNKAIKLMGTSCQHEWVGKKQTK